MSRTVQYEVAIWRVDGDEQEGDHQYFHAGRGGTGMRAAQELFDSLAVDGDIESIELRRIQFVDDEPDTELVIQEKP